MIVVTGAAGFIGSCVLSKLNEIGREDIVVVDHFDGASDCDPLKKEWKIDHNNGGFDHPDVCNFFKQQNLKDKKFIKYCNKGEFVAQAADDTLDPGIDCIIHMGACSSTTLQDAEYFKKNNFEYTKTLAEWALKHNARLIYASSAATYGDGSVGYKDDEATVSRCSPLNLYGASKQQFDQWVIDHGYAEKLVGLKFFNVYGPNEYHKADMRSVVAKAYQKVVEEGKMCLFKSHKSDYADGEQKRDFIYVKDAVDVVMFFFENPQVNGIFNVGTGKARTWKDLACALFAAVGKKTQIEYFDMPETLRGRYQYFTQAEMSKLQKAGYDKPFTSLENAVEDYVSFLRDKRHL